MKASDKVNILLVDDQPAKLLSYEVILGGLGENLIKAGSAREALEHLLKTEIAVILVDVCMPETGVDPTALSPTANWPGSLNPGILLPYLQRQDVTFDISPLGHRLCPCRKP
jgi:hypothetical protein